MKVQHYLKAMLVVMQLAEGERSFCCPTFEVEPAGLSRSTAPGVVETEKMTVLEEEKAEVIENSSLAMVKSQLAVEQVLAWYKDDQQVGCRIAGNTIAAKEACLFPVKFGRKVHSQVVVAAAEEAVAEPGADCTAVAEQCCKPGKEVVEEDIGFVAE